MEMYNNVSTKVQWPCGKLKDIMILQMLDPQTFIVKESRSTSMSHEAFTYSKMEIEMQKYFEDFESETECEFKKGAMCCVKWKGKWVRAQILVKIISPSRGIIMRVLFVDDNEIHNFSKDQVKECPQIWREIPFQAVKIKLIGIQPLRMGMHLDTDVSISANASETWDEASKNFVASSLKDHTKAKLKVLKHTDNEINVELLLHKSDGTVESLKDILLEEKYAILVNSLPETSKGSVCSQKANFDAEIKKISSELNYKEIMQRSKEAASKPVIFDEESTKKKVSNVVPKNLINEKPNQSSLKDRSALINHNQLTQQNIATSTLSSGTGRGAMMQSLFKRVENFEVSSEKVFDNETRHSPKGVFQAPSAFGRGRSSLINSFVKKQQLPKKIEDTCVIPTAPKGRGAMLSKLMQRASGNKPSMDLKYKEHKSIPDLNPTSAPKIPEIDNVVRNKSPENKKTSAQSSTNPKNLLNSLISIKSFKTSAPKHESQVPAPQPVPVSEDLEKAKQDLDTNFSNSSFKESDSERCSFDVSRLSSSSCSKVAMCKEEENWEESDGELREIGHFSSFFDTKMASTFDTLIEHTIGQVFVSGERIPKPFTRVDNNFSNILIHRLHELSFNVPSVIQKHAWPAICRGRNTVVVTLPSNGNILVYTVPILSSLLEFSTYSSIREGNGPLALILCKSSESALFISEVLQKLTAGSNLKCRALYTGIENETKLDLLNQCEVLVTTPRCILRVMKSSKNKITNLDRLCHLILNDADYLTEVFTSEITEIMSQFIKVIVTNNRKHTPQQIVTCSNTWTKSLESFVESYFYVNAESAFGEPLLYFSSFYEAAICSRVLVFTSVVEEEGMLKKLGETLDEIVNKRVVVFTSKKKTSVDLYHLLKSLAKNVLVVNESMNNAEIEGVKFERSTFQDPKSYPILICTDSCISDLNIHDADCIIHYDMPDSSKSTFGKRFVVLKNKLSCRLNDVDPPKCVCYIMLTKNCMKQAPTILSFMRRVNAKVPEQLENMVKLQTKKVESAKHGETLCPYVKSYGECSYNASFKKKCAYRHLLNEKFDFPSKNLPQNGQVKIKITEVLNAVHYFAHIVKHYPDADTLPSHKLPEKIYSEECFSLFLDLNVHFNVMVNQHSANLTDIQVNELYVINLNNSYFSRVKVLKLYKHKDSLPGEVLVFFIDDGITKKVSARCLLLLPSKFSVAPPQAIEVFVCSVMPCDKELNWSEKISKDVKMHILNQELDGKIKLTSGNTLWLDPLVKQQKLNKNTVVNDLTVHKYLLGKNWAVENKGHLPKLIKVFKKCGIYQEERPKLKKHKKKEASATTGSKTRKKSFAFLNMADFNRVQVPVVENPHKFYVRLDAFDGCLEDLSKQLNKWVNAEKRPVMQTVYVDDICLAYYAVDDIWCRSKVIQIDEDSVTVLFVDYGDLNEVPMAEILRLPDNFLLLPFQAIECSLADADLPEGLSTWNKEDAAILMEQLTRDVDRHLAVISLKVFKKIQRPDQGNFYEVFLIKPFMAACSKSVGELLSLQKLVTFKNENEARDAALKHDNCFFSDFDTDSSYDSEENKILKEMDDFRNVTQNIHKEDLNHSKNFSSNVDDYTQNDETYTPNVRWSQTYKYVKIAIQLPEVKEYGLTIGPNSINFSTFLHQRQYSLNIDLFADIVCETDSKDANFVKIFGCEVLITIPKSKVGDEWPRLLADDRKFPWIGIDFDRNELDVESDDDYTFIAEPRIQKKLQRHKESIVKSENHHSSASSSSELDAEDYDIL